MLECISDQMTFGHTLYLSRDWFKNIKMMFLVESWRKDFHLLSRRERVVHDRPVGISRLWLRIPHSGQIEYVIFLWISLYICSVLGLREELSS